jgi:hypothetical protein
MRPLRFFRLSSVKSQSGTATKPSNSTPSFTLSYLLKGFASLWSLYEEQTVHSWDEGVTYGGLINFFWVIKFLVIDQNFRSHFFSKCFDVRAFLKIVEDLKQNPHQVYTDSDTQQTFSALRVNQPLAAISHFSAILTVNPNNLQTYKA